MGEPKNIDTNSATSDLPPPARLSARLWWAGNFQRHKGSKRRKGVKRRGCAKPSLPPCFRVSRVLAHSRPGVSVEFTPATAGTGRSGVGLYLDGKLFSHIRISVLEGPKIPYAGPNTGVSR